MKLMGYIGEMGDLSDYDADMLLPQYKRAGAIAGYDTVYNYNFPCYLGSFTSPITDAQHCTGFNYGLREYLNSRYKLNLHSQYMQIADIGLAFDEAIKSSTDNAVKDFLAIIYVRMQDMASSPFSLIDVLNCYQEMYVATAERVLTNIWDATLMNVSSAFTPSFKFCRGSINKRTPFYPSDRFVTYTDELFMYCDHIPKDIYESASSIKPFMDVKNDYNGMQAYLGFNGSLPGYTSDMFANQHVKGVYAMLGVELNYQEAPYVLYANDVTNRVPFSTLNLFLAPEDGCNFFKDMCDRNVPIKLGTNDEVNKKMVVHRDDLWNMFSAALDPTASSYCKVVSSFYAHYSKAELYKPFDLLSGLRLVHDMLQDAAGSRKVSNNNGTHTLFLDSKYGITVTGPEGTKRDDVYGFMMQHIETHCNHQGMEDWKQLKTVLFDMHGRFNGNLEEVVVEEVTRITSDKTKMVEVFKNTNLDTLGEVFSM